MREIMRSQWYQAARDKSMWAASIVFIGLAAMIWWLGADDMTGDDIVSGTEALYGDANLPAVMLFAFVIALSMCRDYKDKTLYCDILAGYKRGEVFWGRVIPAFVIGAAFVFVLTYADVVYYTAANGWGSDITALSMLVRMIMFLLYLFRIMGEIALLAVLIRRTTVVYILALVAGYVEQRAILMTVIQGKDIVIKHALLLAGFAFKVILQPGTASVFDGEGEIVTSFEPVLPLAETAFSMTSSLLIGGIGLYAACRIMKKQELC